MSETGNDETAVCYTCELIARRDEGGAPLWDNILRTNNCPAILMSIFMSYRGRPISRLTGAVPGSWPILA